MAEIATYTMIKTKTSYGTTGNECPTKTVIKSISSYISIANDSSYGTNECVKLEDISVSAYTFTVANNSKSIAAGGGTSTAVDFTSYKIVNSVQSNVSYSLTSTLPSWLTWNASARTFTATNNTGSARSFTATFTQAESGKTVTASVSQAAVSITYGEWKVSVSANPTTIAAAGGTSTITATAVRDVFTNGVKTGTDTATPTLSISGTGFTLSGTTVTASNNTGSARTCTVTASHGGKTATATITQSAANISYTFTVNGGASTSFSFSNTGGSSTSFTFVSTKTVNSTTTNISYSQTSTLPSWLTWDSANRQLTATANTGVERTATVTFTQSESNKTVSITVVQGEASDTYNFYISNYNQTIDWDEATTEVLNIISTKTTPSGVTTNISYEVSTGDIPSWLQYNSSGKYFVASNNTSSSSRTAKIYFTQAESGNRDYVLITQAGKTVSSYVFHIGGEVNINKSIDYNGGDIKLYVSSTKDNYDQPFTIWESDASWISAPASGTGSQYITLTVQPSNNIISRTGTIKYVQNESGLLITIVVTQGSAPIGPSYVFTWGDNSTVTKTGTCPATFTTPFHLGDTGGVISKKTQTGQPDQSVTYTYTKPDWITGIDIDEDMVYVTGLQNNTSTSSRTGVLKLTQAESGKTLTMNVTQSGASQNYVFTINGKTQEAFGLTYNATIETLQIVSTLNGSNQPWSLSSNTGTGWITPSASSGLGSVTNTISITENTSTSTREANLTYTQQGSGEQIIVQVRQTGKPADNYQFYIMAEGQPTTNTYNKSVYAGNTYTSINSIKNGSEQNLTASSNASWLTATVTQGGSTGTHLITMTVTSNEYSYYSGDRTAVITLTQAESGKVITLTVIQASDYKVRYKGIQILSMSSQRYSSTEDYVVVDFDSNERSFVWENSAASVQLFRTDSYPDTVSGVNKIHLKCSSTGSGKLKPTSAILGRSGFVDANCSVDQGTTIPQITCTADSFTVENGSWNLVIVGFTIGRINCRIQKL